MELLERNFLNTTTQLTLPDNSETAQNLFNRDLKFEYGTSNFADDLTTGTITISFDNTITLNRIALVAHNLKSYTIYYNGSTANTLNLTSTAGTTVSDFSSNSSTSQYFRFDDIDATSLSIDMKSTIVANTNKKIGYFATSSLKTNFGGRSPSFKNYNPTLDTKNVIHNLSDGKKRVQVIDDNWEVSFGIEYVTESIRDDLREVYDDHLDMIFVPFGTSGSWDKVIFPCSWIGPFEFYKYSDNTPDTGFSGSIRLVEVGI